MAAVTRTAAAISFSGDTVLVFRQPGRNRLDAMKMPLWQFDEAHHGGEDFASRKVVAACNIHRGKFRDVPLQSDHPTTRSYAAGCNSTSRSPRIFFRMLSRGWPLPRF